MKINTGYKIIVIYLYLLVCVRMNIGPLQIDLMQLENKNPISYKDYQICMKNNCE